MSENKSYDEVLQELLNALSKAILKEDWIGVDELSSAFSRITP